MTWSRRQRFREGRRLDPTPSGLGYRANPVCFIRKDHSCGKIFGASKSCFVACPRNDELEPLLELITEKAAKHGVDAVIAVKERAYGQDIFCTKICGRIIESKFCLVVLDDTVMDGKNVPNPNVYYEYGLMTSLNKHIIPLQKEDLNLAFNIQSYDTIKYSSKNMGSELDRAIKDAMRTTDIKPEEKGGPLPQRELLRSFEVAGFDEKDDQWRLSSVIDDTGFIGFGLPDEGAYAYVGKVDDVGDMDEYLSDMKVVMYRTEKEAKALDSELAELAKLTKEQKERTSGQQYPRSYFSFRGRPLDVDDAKGQIDSRAAIRRKMQCVYIGFMMGPGLDASRFKEEAGNAVSKYPRFKLTLGDCQGIAFDGVEVRFQQIEKG